GLFAQAQLPLLVEQPVQPLGGGALRLRGKGAGAQHHSRGKSGSSHGRGGGGTVGGGGVAQLARPPLFPARFSTIGQHHPNPQEKAGEWLADRRRISGSTSFNQPP